MPCAWLRSSVILAMNSGPFSIRIFMGLARRAIKWFNTRTTLVRVLLGFLQ